jgi:hypothetical protein
MDFLSMRTPLGSTPAYYSERSRFKVNGSVQRFKGSAVQRQRGRIGVFIPGILPRPTCSNYSVVERLNLALPYLRARADVDSAVG